MKKHSSKDSPKLYGLENSSRRGSEHFTKNCFNSSFPISLALYMADKGLGAVFLNINKTGDIADELLSWEKIFAADLSNLGQLFWDFEKKFPDYEKMAHNGIPSVDVVLKSNAEEPPRPIRPFEIKLTVLPDSTTSKRAEQEWGSEIVIRPQTIKYCCLSLAANNQNNWGRITKILNPICQRITHWGSENDVLKQLDQIIESLQQLLLLDDLVQTPILLNPIWKTKGHSSLLESNAFDYFVWSDAALVRLILAQSVKIKKKVSRPQRALLQIARALNELSIGRPFNIDAAFASISYSQQSDKALSVAGRVTSKYYPRKYIINPRVQKFALPDIIRGNGHQHLKPERRFDATVYFQTAELFESQQDIRK